MRGLVPRISLGLACRCLSVEMAGTSPAMKRGDGFAATPHFPRSRLRPKRRIHSHWTLGDCETWNFCTRTFATLRAAGDIEDQQSGFFQRQLSHDFAGWI